MKNVVKNTLVVTSTLLMVLACVVGYKYLSGQSLGARLNQAEKTLYTTSTNALGGIPAINVNDFQNIGVSVASNKTSSTLFIGCSMQDDAPNFGAATSTSNRWAPVDFVNTLTDASVDGFTGIPMSNFTGTHQLVVRNSVFKWCSVILSGNTTPAGYGTTTVYMKTVDAQ